MLPRLNKVTGRRIAQTELRINDLPANSKTHRKSKLSDNNKSTSY